MKNRIIWILFPLGKFGQRRTAPSADDGSANFRPLFLGRSISKTARSVLTSSSSSLAQTDRSSSTSFTPSPVEKKPAELSIVFIFFLSDRIFSKYFRLQSVSTCKNKSQRFHLHFYAQRRLAFSSMFVATRSRRISEKFVTNLLFVSRKAWRWNQGKKSSSKLSLRPENCSIISWKRIWSHYLNDTRSFRFSVCDFTPIRVSQSFHCWRFRY